jgi:hypothetical protein
MARRITRRSKAIVSSGLHPHYVSVCKTMAKFTGDELETSEPTLEAATDADRLIAAIDDMLNAPNARPPIALAATPDGHYVFADPTWESLSVGQKLMIRIGPEHERALKARLRSIRALLLGQAPVFHPAAEAQPAAASSSH